MARFANRATTMPCVFVFYAAQPCVFVSYVAQPCVFVFYAAHSCISSCYSLCSDASVRFLCQLAGRLDLQTCKQLETDEQARLYEVKNTRYSLSGASRAARHVCTGTSETYQIYSVKATALEWWSSRGNQDPERRCRLWLIPKRALVSTSTI